MTNVKPRNVTRHPLDVKETRIGAVKVQAAWARSLGSCIIVEMEGRREGRKGQANAVREVRPSKLKNIIQCLRHGENNHSFRT